MVLQKIMTLPTSELPSEVNAQLQLSETNAVRIDAIPASAGTAISTTDMMNPMECRAHPPSVKTVKNETTTAGKEMTGAIPTRTSHRALRTRPRHRASTLGVEVAPVDSLSVDPGPATGAMH